MREEAARVTAIKEQASREARIAAKKEEEVARRDVERALIMQVLLKACTDKGLSD